MEYILHNSEHYKDDVVAYTKFFDRIHELDGIYDEEDQGTAAAMCDRFPANEKTYLYITPANSDEIVGYINFFPVSNDLYDKITDPATPYDDLDDAISVDDIEEYKVRGNNVFILSIVIAPDHQGKATATLLSNGFVEYLKSMGPDSFESITACAISPSGKKFLSHLRFRFHHSVYSVEELAENPELDPYDFNSTRAILICDNEDEFFEEELEGADDLFIPEYDEADSGIKNTDASADSENNTSDVCENSDDSDDDEYSNKPLPGSLDHGGSLSRLFKYGPYVKSYHDDIYLIMPLAEHPNNPGTEILFNSKEFYVEGSRHSSNNSHERIIETDDDAAHVLTEAYYDELLSISDPSSRKRKIASRLVAKMRECIDYECSNSVASDLDILYLGCYTFLHTTDQYPCEDRRTEINDEIIVGTQEGYVLLTAHRKTHLYTLTVYFPDYKYSTTQLEDQLSNNYIKIIDPRDKSKWIRLYDYLHDQYYLHRCGQEKVLLCMSNPPKQGTEMQNILSAEVYNSAKLLYHIDSDELRDLCEIEHSQYDYYDVYLSNKVIAFIPHDYFDMDINERIDITATYSFIAELVIFQNTSLARMNIKVTQALEDDGDVSLEDVLELDKQYGQTIPFWDPTNFKYYGTQQEAAKILEAFSNEDLKNTYNEYQQFLENLVTLQASERENRNDLFLNIAATVLAILQVQSFIVNILESIYIRLGLLETPDEIEITSEAIVNKDFTSLMFGGILVFLLITIIIRRKKKNSRKRR